MTVKEWVAWVLELNEYLKDFPAQNRNKIQLLDKDKIMDILEYGVPVPCKPSADKPKDEKSPKPKNARIRKADAPTKPTGEKKFHCDLYGRNKTHNTKDCYKLKLHTKHTKQGKACKDMDKVTYKDLNTFINAKVTAAFKKAKKNFKKEKKDKQ
eukprot:10201273-Ditylum_brightwellii.AAC.1